MLFRTRFWLVEFYDVSQFFHFLKETLTINLIVERQEKHADPHLATLPLARRRFASRRSHLPSLGVLLVVQKIGGCCVVMVFCFVTYMRFLSSFYFVCDCIFFGVRWCWMLMTWWVMLLPVTHGDWKVYQKTAAPASESSIPRKFSLIKIVIA